ncbi:MAG: Crp/Fnr family transcriptional regulator [Deltaproteobacteria bacterium]|nr:Crp/Fnr family transcriptional regulator [Deltaproteobacteria bacterium]
MDKDKAKEFEVYANKLYADNLREDRLASSKEKHETVRFLKGGEIVSQNEKQDMISALRSLPLLNEIDEKDLEHVLDEIILARVKTGDYIFKTGDSPDFMYLIFKGQMKIYFNTIDGDEQIFYIYKEGDFVGGHNLLMKTNYRYMGRALTDCKVVAIPKDTFHKYFYNSPELLRSVLSKSFERIRWAEDLIQRLSTSNATMKTAGLLIKLKNRIGIETEEGIRLELPLNREELGNYSGLRRETITRKLGEFKELGYIDLQGNKVIIIKDLESLEDYIL